MEFKAKTNPLLDELLANEEYLFEMQETYGDLLNVIFPQNIKQNIIEFEDCFKKHSLKGSIYYAHKCNHSASIVTEMLNNNVNIDVASEEELKHVLGLGYVGSKIEATGPKNTKFITLGLRHDILFNVDNLQELEEIIKVSDKLKKKTKTKILVRLNNFTSGSKKIVSKQSRFGISKDEIDKVLDVIKANEKLDLKGFSFHLDTINSIEKAIAIENIIEIFQKCYELELEPWVINIGGGFKVNYIESEEHWNNGISELKEKVLEGSNDLYNNTTYGMQVVNGSLKGVLNTYNYFDKVVKADFLDEILETRLVRYQNRKIGEILSDNMIELMIEPGKSLIDNVGINIATVNFVKESPNKDMYVGLSMNRSNLLIGEQEMLVDPVMIYQNELIGREDIGKVGVYFIGNLCMENDILNKHKIYLDQEPKKGDLVIFINTAGYFMDFNESKTIMQPLARKIVVTKTNKFKSMLEENYC